jgi:hypothetical protein
MFFGGHRRRHYSPKKNYDDYSDKGYGGYSKGYGGSSGRRYGRYSGGKSDNYDPIYESIFDYDK